MNLYLLIAATLTTILAFAHSILGEIKIFSKMNSHSLPLLKGLPMIGSVDAPTKRTVRMTWHMVTALALGIVSILIKFAGIPELDETEKFITLVIGVVMFLMALISL